ERAEGEVERARRELVAAEAALVAAEEVAAVERERWAADVRAAQDEAERVGRLVEVGARPSVEAVEAGLRVEEAQWREVEGLTRWTSERGRLVYAVDTRRIAVSEVETHWRHLLSEQWVRAPTGGVVIKVAPE